MPDYNGKICPYCKTEFAATDDIVECSMCEMPHHKDCWVENKGCTTFGCTGTIKGVNVELEQPFAATFCPKCGAKNNAASGFCGKCGNKLAAQQNTNANAFAYQTQQPVYQQPQPIYQQPQPITYQQPQPIFQQPQPVYQQPQPITYQQQQPIYQQPQPVYQQVQPNYQQQQSYYVPPVQNNYSFQANSSYANQNAITNDMFVIIKDNADFYLEKYIKFKRNGSKVSWNWACFFLNFIWLFYRKMYGLSVAFLAAYLTLYYLLPEIARVIQLPINISLCMFVNYIYLNRAEKEVIKANSMLAYEKQLYLSKKGGTNVGGAIAFAVGYIALVILISYSLVNLI